MKSSVSNVFQGKLLEYKLRVRFDTGIVNTVQDLLSRLNEMNDSPRVCNENFVTDSKR